MKKRPTNTKIDTRETTTQDGMSWLERLDAIVESDTFRIVSGSLLLLMMIYTLLACVSYFWCGESDQSTLAGNMTAHSKEVLNWGGAVGARLAEWLINGGFGIPTLIIPIALLLVSLKLIGAYKSLPLWKLFFHSSFWLIWTSIFIDYNLVELFRLDGFFLWGGAHGMAMDNLMISYIGMPGAIIILLATMLIYWIIVSEKTIPLLKHSGCWMKEKATGLTSKSTEEFVPEVATAAQHEEQDDDIIEEFVEEPEVVPASEPTPKASGADSFFNTPDWMNAGAATAEPKAEEIKQEEPVQEPAAEPEVTVDPLPTTPATPETPESQPIVGSEPVRVDEKFTVSGTSEEMVSDETTQGLTEDPAVVVNNGDKLWSSMEPYDPRADLSHFEFPPLSLLKTYPNENAPIIDMEEQQANKNRIVQTLRDYGIEIEKIMATVGPTITLYEIVPKAGTRINKIRSLSDDIMLSLKATGIRIIAPIPGKGTVGIEVPNEKPQIVSMHSVIASKKFQEERKMALPVALGRTITNEVYMFDLAKTPHLLVAGATGQGKSVGLNAIVTSLLYKKHPSELKFVLVDPKMVEFNIYAVLEKHYIAKLPEEEKVIITESDKVINTLNSLVVEMENRYRLLMEANCRNIKEYNEKFINRQLNPEKGHRFMPYIVIIIDEFGDFIMVAGKDVETPIARITQKARAVGMHMILATQRPSVNIITGVIKANVPARMAFRCSSMIDSRTVLDEPGAQQLVGKGDLLYKGGSECDRVQCAFVDTPEVEEIVNYISEQQAYPEAYALPDAPDPEAEGGMSRPGSVDLSKRDPLFTDAARFVVANQQGSTSILQRRFEIGYNRAGKLSDQLEAAGIVGPNNGPKGRPVLVDEFGLEQILQGLLHS